MRTLLFVLPWAALGIALALVAAGAAKGRNIFKNQGVAWIATIIMVIAAIGIGYAKAPVNNPAPEPNLPSQTIPPASANSFVWDEADVLSSQAVRALNERNQRLWERYSVSIGVVTCNYGGDGLDQYALKCAEDMGLGGYDFIVALDISGDNYWLVQGADLVRDFTNSDCSDYACDYMERGFDRGDYDDAVLTLTEALENWYADYFG